MKRRGPSSSAPSCALTRPAQTTRRQRGWAAASRRRRFCAEWHPLALLETSAHPAGRRRPCFPGLPLPTTENSQPARVHFDLVGLTVQAFPAPVAAGLALRRLYLVHPSFESRLWERKTVAGVTCTAVCQGPRTRVSFPAAPGGCPRAVAPARSKDSWSARRRVSNGADGRAGPASGSQQDGGDRRGAGGRTRAWGRARLRALDSPTRFVLTARPREARRIRGTEKLSEWLGVAQRGTRSRDSGPGHQVPESGADLQDSQ